MAPCVQGLATDPQNRVSAPPSFQGRFVIDPESFWDQFGDDFEDLSAGCVRLYFAIKLINVYILAR